MAALMATRAGQRTVWLLGGVLAVGLALGVGYLVPARPILAVAVVGVVLVLGLTMADVAAIPLLAVPLMLVVRRVGGAGLDLSISDAALGAATLTALVFAPRPFSPALRGLLWLSSLYQFATLFTVIANPYVAGVVEWFHTWALVAGALIIGWTIGRSGHARSGLNLLLGTALVLALITLFQGLRQYATGDFGPVYLYWPYGMHKNFVGTMLGFAAIVAYARPLWLGWRKRWALTAFTVYAVAIMMTQSRQALVGLAVALVVIVMRGDAHRRRSKIILALVVPATVVVVMTVREQLASGNAYNSANTRLAWLRDTVAYWATSPWVGHGLRYWYRPGEPTFQPPNAEMEVIAAAGIVGLAAFLVLMIGALPILWRLDPAYGTLAVAVQLSRIFSGQLDLFWVTAQASVPFLVIGICLGALDRAQRQSPPAPVLAASGAGWGSG